MNEIYSRYDTLRGENELRGICEKKEARSALEGSCEEREKRGEAEERGSCGDRVELGAVCGGSRRASTDCSEARKVGSAGVTHCIGVPDNSATRYAPPLVAVVLGVLALVGAVLDVP